MEQDNIENMCAHTYPVIFVRITEKNTQEARECMHVNIKCTYMLAWATSNERTRV